MSKSSDKKKDSGDRVGVAQMIRMVWRFTGSENRTFILSGIMLALEAATAVMIPLLVAYVIDYLAVRLAQLGGKPVLPPPTPLQFVGLPTVVSPEFDTIAIVTVGIILLTMINSLCDSLAEIYLAQGGRRLGYNLRVSLYAHLQKLSLAFHDQRRTGDILTRVTGDVAALEDFIISSLSDFVGSVLLIAFILGAMLANAWQVALVAAVIIPIMALISTYFTRRIKAASKKRRSSEGELASATQEMLTSIRVIQTYGLGSYEQAMFAEQSHKAMDSALEAARYQAQFSWVVSVLGSLSIAAVIWMAVWLIFRTPATIVGIGLLTAYVKYIQDMFKPTKRIIQEWNTFGKLYASVERIGDLLDLKPAVQDLPGAVEAPQLAGRVEFRNVGFSYQPVSADGEKSNLTTRTALKNVSFEIEPGQVVALVGHTGAGKSTIVQLLPRLYDPTEGQILIDGHDLREFTLDSLRGQISMVLQESILFSGSVVENIAYGRPDATGRQIVTAAQQANAHEFIEKLPEGYFTMLGERGSNLSGGQRQRIAIARAFVRNTSLLILDEPTTGLDAESTELVLRALKTLMKGKTTIIISHDLSLIRNADKIIVINQGEVEQIGTHESLLKTGGLYATLYQMQTGQVQGTPAAVSLPAVAVTGPNGSSTSRERSRLQEGNLDIPHHPGLLKKLPALALAFDDQVMRLHLQEALLAEGYSIESCKAGKAIYLPGGICSMQYALKLRREGEDGLIPSLVNARLFPKAKAAQSYRHERLEPLASQAQGRPELVPYSHPVAVLTDLAMAVCVFPIDGEIPTLVGATDPEHMLPVFRETLPEALSGTVSIDAFRLEPAHYGRFLRCVLRYRLQEKPAEGGADGEQVVYGKVIADGRGGLAVPVINTLRERLRDSRSPYSFRIPRPLAYLPDLKLLLMEALPGAPVHSTLWGTVLSGEEPPADGALSLEEVIQVNARIAAAFHSSGIQIGPRRTIKTDLDRLADEMAPIRETMPELGSQLQAWLERVTRAGEATQEFPLVFSHGDYTHTQLIFSGKEAGLVDFDTVCQAEPALDLGQFLAYHRLTIYKDQPPDKPYPAEVVEGLCQLFLASYVEATRDWIGDDTALRARVEVYELISLLRLAVHSWQKLKGPRMQSAMDLIEERMACLEKAG